MAKKNVSEHVERHVEKLKQMDEKFKQKIDRHYGQLKKLQSQVANKRIMFFVTLLILYLMVLFAHEWSVISIPTVLIDSSRLILTILITFTASSVIIRIFENRVFSFFENEIEIEKRLFYTKLFTLLIYLFAIILSLYWIGFTFTNLTLVAGLITTAFALSLRDVIISYFVWMILLFKRPFRIGDYIKIGEDEGQVEHIGTFFVTIDDGTENPMRSIKIPTQTFLSKTIITFGTGDVPDTIRIKVQSLPKDTTKRLEELTAAVKHITKYDRAEVTLDIDGEQPVFVIHYESPFVTRKNVRSSVIARVYEMNADLRVKP